jgi:hypothetical protein
MAKSPDEKSGVATERRLQKAIERITENKPKHPILRKRLAQGTLRLNVTSVALEAGVSRTLIGHKGCAYQTVRDKGGPWRDEAPREEAYKQDGSNIAQNGLARGDCPARNETVRTRDQASQINWAANRVAHHS